MPAILKTFLGAVAAATVVSLCSAQAATVEDAMRRFGLIGHWAAQCDQPAAPGNAHAYFEETSPGVMRERFDQGPTQDPHIYDIVDAAPVSGVRHQIRVVTQYDGGHLTLIIRRQGNQIRTLSNIAPDGTVHVKDGIVVSNGNETPTLTRCN